MQKRGISSCKKHIEQFNKPESEWLNKFAKTAQSVVEGAQRIESARKLTGLFDQYDNEKLRFKIGDGKFEYLTPGFDVTLDFLDVWLERYLDVFLINDVVIRVRQNFHDENGEYQVVEYPSASEE